MSASWSRLGHCLLRGEAKDQLGVVAVGKVVGTAGRRREGRGQWQRRLGTPGDGGWQLRHSYRAPPRAPRALTVILGFRAMSGTRGAHRGCVRYGVGGRERSWRCWLWGTGLLPILGSGGGLGVPLGFQGIGVPWLEPARPRACLRVYVGRREQGASLASLAARLSQWGRNEWAEARCWALRGRGLWLVRS